MALSESIEAEIGKRFAEANRDAIRALLADCHSDRVRLSILWLSRGQVSRVEDLVKAAKRDYRDVIAWASQPTRRYIVGLLRKGPQWSPEDEHGRTHLNPQELKRWKDMGAIVIGGWFLEYPSNTVGDPRGLYIFTVDSVEEAEALVQSDEAILSGKLKFEFHSWLAPDGLMIAAPGQY